MQVTCVAPALSKLKQRQSVKSVTSFTSQLRLQHSVWTAVYSALDSCNVLWFGQLQCLLQDVGRLHVLRQ